MKPAAAQIAAGSFELAIMQMLEVPGDYTHGTANNLGERYGNAIEVQDTGTIGDSVDHQLARSAATALRIGQLVLDKGLTPPGKYLLIKLALRRSKGIFTDTFTVRYAWQDVLRLAKARAQAAKLVPLGQMESIWIDYWPTMCANKPPPELFAGGDGQPESPEDVVNPSNKDLSCRRRR